MAGGTAHIEAGDNSKNSKGPLVYQIQEVLLLSIITGLNFNNS